MTKPILILFLMSTLVLGTITPYHVFADEDDDDQKTKFKKHKVHTGDGPPPNGLGKVGDLYIDSSDTDNLIIYKKTGKNTWTNLGSFQGEPGTQGPTGPQGLQGEKGDKGDAGEQGPAGQDGQNCWDLNGNGIKDLPDEDTNRDGRVDILDCKGPKGDKGDKGDTGETGPQGPIATQDFHFVMQRGDAVESNGQILFGTSAFPEIRSSEGTAISWDGEGNVFIIRQDGNYEVNVDLLVIDSTPTIFEEARLQLMITTEVGVPPQVVGFSTGDVGRSEQISSHWIGHLEAGQQIFAKIFGNAEMKIKGSSSTMSVKKLS